MIKPVIFTADGSTYNCVFTNSAMVEYENKYDESFLSVAEKFSEGQISTIKVKVVQALFCVAIRACNKELKDDDILQLSEKMPVGEMLGLIAKALANAFPSEPSEPSEPSSTPENKKKLKAASKGK